MSLSAGTRLGPYEILTPIGAGGMGEVYQARDTRLDRTVAIKISAAQFTERFEREARAVAALNHPHICTLHDIGPDYLVMEFVEGPTLADRIAAGPIPLPEVLAIARQIGEALQAAHEKSIVHRDLKPANVKFTSAGQVKVLDFGLAKALDAEPVPDSRNSPTLTLTSTRAGVILGTAAYMSPEQARGLAADKRADIWSFGVVLYEMLSRRNLFAGDTVSDTLAGVLKTDPDWKALPPETPPSIRRLLRRALQRDRNHRLHDIADALLEIDDASAEPSTPIVSATPAAPKSATRFIPWILAALLALALPLVWLLRPKPPERVFQLEISSPSDHTFGTNNSFRYAVSPDGSKVAFVATANDGRRSLWLRPLHALEATQLPGTAGAIGPFWDPTSRWIAFAAAGKLQKIDVRGGQPQVLCDISGGSISGTWNRDGVILFHDGNRRVLRVSAAGGASSPVLPMDKSRKETSQLAPAFLPDGRRFLYGTFAEKTGVGLGSLDGKSSLLMVNPSSPASCVPGRDGRFYLIFLRRDQLMAQQFNTAGATMMGEPVTLAEPLQSGPSYSASDNGVLIFRRSRGGRARFTWFDREGKTLGTVGTPGLMFGPRISPDQKSIAFHQRDGMIFDVWLFDLERGNTTRFTLGPETAFHPVWSPDGSRIVYSARKPNEYAIVERPAGGIGKEVVLYRSQSIYYPESWFRDGRWLVLANPFGDPLLLLPMGADGSAAERKPVSLPDSPAEVRHPSISPDGRWLLYSSTQTGGREVFLESMPEQLGGPSSGSKKQVSIEGGSQPLWRADSKELFYIAADGKLMAVSVESGPATLKLGVPKPLFQTRLEFDSSMWDYDVAADGKRFLLAQPLEEAAAVPITVIINWPALMKQSSSPQ